MKHGIVNREQTSLFFYQGWPSVCIDKEGVLYAVSSGHRVGHVCPFGKNLLYVSRDGGETWSGPRIANDTPLDDRDAGITYLGDGKLLLSWFNLPRSFYWNMEENILSHQVRPGLRELAKGALENWKSLPKEREKIGSFVRLSRNKGDNWEDAVYVPVSTPHGPILLKNGKLLYFGKYLEDIEKEKAAENKAIAAYESADDGKTWSLVGEVPLSDDGLTVSAFHEPHVVELSNGRLLGAIRVHGTTPDTGFTIYLTHSDDGGKTWTVPTPTGIIGSPPHLLLHSSGAVIMTYGYRRSPYGQRTKISRDGGQTWSHEIIVNDQGIDGDLGYPCTVELPDGSLITVYYQKLPGDNFCSVLYTKWTLAEFGF